MRMRIEEIRNVQCDNPITSAFSNHPEFRVFAVCSTLPLPLPFSLFFPFPSFYPEPYMEAATLLRLEEFRPPAFDPSRLRTIPSPPPSPCPYMYTCTSTTDFWCVKTTPEAKSSILATVQRYHQTEYTIRLWLLRVYSHPSEGTGSCWGDPVKRAGKHN
jgi:hypothetical protein